MPVLFGRQREDGNIIVQKTLHRVKGEEVVASDYPDGYEFDELPETPASKRGVEPVMIFDPRNKKFIWEEKEKQLEDTDKLDMILEKMDELLKILTK